MDERERYGQGMKVRRAVLGDAHVDRSLKNRNEFNEEFQDFITRYAWGEIWTRPGLPRKTRSLITLAMMVALNRSDEFRMHVRAAVNNGVTRDEIKEVLLQTAIYCGVPAANSAFHIAEEAFAGESATDDREPPAETNGQPKTQGQTERVVNPRPYCFQTRRAVSATRRNFAH